MQPYTVNLPEKLLPLAEQTESGVIVWLSQRYDDNFGVIDADLFIPPASLIV